jgi:hypothetical protein
MPQAASSASKGFLKSLYDFKFSTFVTSKVVRVLYVIITILYSLGAVAFFIKLISKGGSYVVVAIIVVPLAYLLYLTLARICLEFIIVVFRIGEDVRNIRDARTAPQESESPHTVLAPAADQPSQPSTTYPAGWYNDPSGLARARFWDGQGWTEHTQD